MTRKISCPSAIASCTAAMERCLLTSKCTTISGRIVIPRSGTIGMLFISLSIQFPPEYSNAGTGRKYSCLHPRNGFVGRNYAFMIYALSDVRKDLRSSPSLM